MCIFSSFIVRNLTTFQVGRGEHDTWNTGDAKKLADLAHWTMKNTR
jgi:hypothetical protein